MTSKRAIEALTFVAVVCLLLATVNLRPSNATPKVGLFAEQSTEVIGVKVARVVDTKNGNVCYVARHVNWEGTAAISCIVGKP